MRTIKLIHSADFHLDSPFEALPAARAAVRRSEQRDLLASLVRLADEERADLVLLSGDLLDSGNTFYETGEELVRALSACPCPVFLSPGNHDFYSAASPYARLKLPEQLHLFTKNEISFLSVPSADARVYGAAFTDRSCPALLRGFHAERKAGVYNLLCLHGEVGNPASLCNPISTEELASSGMDYAALGHIHAASGLLKSGNTWYSWPGCPEGRGFDETGEKTVNIVTLEGSKASLETRSIAKRRYYSVSMDVTGKDPLLLIHTSLPDDSVDDIYRITLIGTSERSPDLRRLQQNLDGMFFSLQLLDHTVPPADLWEYAGNDTLRGIFLAKLKARYDAAEDDAAKLRIEQAVRWGLAALDNAEEVAVHDHS
ncbi:MAG: DNA repair exonuclease [Oscillospiraceae bacterium]|nr:DNA repair exonuclease [Oscillospiraceae bacterium]